MFVVFNVHVYTVFNLHVHLKLSFKRVILGDITRVGMPPKFPGHSLPTTYLVSGYQVIVL